MTTKVLEIKRYSFDYCSTRTLVRKCHDSKNIVIVNQDNISESEKEWKTMERSEIMIPMSYLKPIMDYAQQNDCYNMLKTPPIKKFKRSFSPDEKQLVVYSTPIVSRVIKARTLPKPSRQLFKAYDYDCVPFTENYLGVEMHNNEVDLFWELQNTPDLGVDTPFLDDDVLETPPNRKMESDDELNQTPLVAKCFAPPPKKCRRDLSSESIGESPSY